MKTATETKTVEVWEQFHNGNCWQTIEGAAWDMEWAAGETFRDACIRHGGEFDRDESFRLIVLDEDGAEYASEIFEPGDI